MKRLLHAATLSAGLVTLAGCAGVPVNQPIKTEKLAAMQPVDVKLGVTQAELYASFVPSNAGAAGAAGCAAVPGLGVLLAAACGGVLGAMDASINAARAKEADEHVRPIKDEVVDLEFDPLIRHAVKQSFEEGGLRLVDVAVTKTTTNAAYANTFAAADASSVLFVTLDYHLTPDFSALELSARGLIYPRSAAAREAVGLAALPPSAATNSSDKNALPLNEAAFRTQTFYRAKLPNPGKDIPANVALWKADNARLMRSALNASVPKVAQLLVQELQNPAERTTTGDKVEIANGLMGTIVSKNETGVLLRASDGSIHFQANLEAIAAAFDQHNTASAPVATATATATAQ